QVVPVTHAGYPENPSPQGRMMVPYRSALLSLVDPQLPAECSQFVRPANPDRPARQVQAWDNPPKWKHTRCLSIPVDILRQAAGKKRLTISVDYAHTNRLARFIFSVFLTSAPWKVRQQPPAFADVRTYHFFALPFFEWHLFFPPLSVTRCRVFQLIAA